MNLFIIPGNPPALFFYEEWKKEWLAQHPEHTFHISHYPDIEINQESELFFAKIADFHVNNFLNFQKNTKGPIVIIGHSLGGYFAKILSKKFTDSVSKCILIHPFLRKPERRAEIFLKSLRVARKWNGFERLLLKNKIHLEKINPDLRNVTQTEAIISLKLAYHEVKTIVQDKSPVEIPSTSKEKYHLYYTQNDRWCTPQVIKQLKQQIAHKEVSASHDFVRLKLDREVMTHHIQELLSLKII